VQYRTKPHRFWLADLIAPRCERVFISVNHAQEQVNAGQYTYVVDAPAYADNGPIGGLMSACAAHGADAAWLVISCDLPYFDEAALAALLTARDDARAATAFLNPEINMPEPLITIYEPVFMRGLAKAFAAGERSLRRLLAKADTNLIRPQNPRWIESANTPAARNEALKRLGRT
jgi:molybdopterin-guanine dinucleotide biosynthesis protein A